jgi:sugar phosphate isomerase/epimerase
VADWNQSGVSDRISVSAICSNKLSLEEDLELWESLGVRAVGIPLRKLGNGDARRIADTEIRVTSLLGYGPRLDDPGTWSSFAAELREAFENAHAVNAEVLVITSGCAGSMSWERSADAFAKLIDSLVLDPSIPLLVEHTNQLRTDISFLHRLRDAVDVAREVGIGVVMETNACWYERALETTIAESVDVIGLVQVSDASGVSLSTPDRLVPGDGVIPLPVILGQLLSAGYQGFFELEYAGPKIEEEGYAQALKRALPSTSSILRDAVLAAESQEGRPSVVSRTS